MDTQSWKDIITQLLAYAHQLMKAHKWFRGDSDTSVKGMQAEDYVQEAIARYLKDPEKYDTSKGSLIKFLKYYILRQLVSNDSKSLENRSYSDIFQWQRNNSDDCDDFVETVIPFVSANFGDDLDYFQILSDIRIALESDPICLTLFELIRERGFKRRDVIKEAKITEGEFDNAMKRLDRTLKKISKKYSINQTL